MCPNCKRELTRMLALDTSDPKLQDLRWQWPQIELLFCWPCGLAQGAFSYKQTAAQEITLLQVNVGECLSDFPYEGYPRLFTECAVELEPQEAELAQNLEEYYALQDADERRLDKRWSWPELDKITTPRHQVGGIPFLFDDSPQFCPTCTLEMRFLATIADVTPAQERFVGAEYVQVVFYVCSSCLVVAARQECD